MALIRSAFLITLAVILGPLSIKGEEDTAQDIALPSGITLQPIPEDGSLTDVETTGSYLFKIGQGGVTEDRRLSLNVAVSDWRDKRNQAFRIHPVYIDCVQRVWTELQNGGRKPRIVEAFLAEGGDSVRDRYRKSGTGAALGFDTSVTNKDYKLMATSFLRHCPPLFAPLGRDLGMVIEGSSIFAYMTGTKSPSIQSITVSGNSQFNGVDINSWVRDRLNEVTDPIEVPKCNADIAALTNGGIHPPSAPSDPSVTVGRVDKVVKRATADPDRQDFLRLIQFPSDNVEFAIPSATPNCPAAGGIHGNSPTTRCGPRLMAPRMYKMVNALQKLVRSSLSSKLRVEEGWTEGSVDAASQLRNEARQIKVRLASSNTEARLKEMSKLAICAGFDFVKLDGNHLILAVAKQLHTSTKPVDFSSGRLLPVAAPQNDWDKLYKLPAGFDGKENPLFDSQFRSSVKLYDGATASSFKSKESDVRYFRLSPMMADCYSNIVEYENQGKASSDPKIGITVVRAYMSAMEEASAFNPVTDFRINKHTLGIALHLAYSDPPKGYDVWRLARTVASVCPFIFHNQKDNSHGGNTGIGVYSDGVYVDVRNLNKVWFSAKSSDSADTLREQLLKRIEESQMDRVIIPNDYETACKFDNPPKPQDPSFVFQHSLATRRVRRSTRSSAECEIRAGESPFCQKSRAQRQIEVERIREIIHKKHLLVDKSRVNAALDGCLLTCSSCTTGPEWDDKLEHCSNLVHWIPFNFLNDLSETITNIYPLIDKMARRHACEQGGHCLDKTPIYALFAPALINSKFRPEAGKANKELVYDPVENPSSLISIMTNLYALMARGKAKLWLRSEADIAGMENALKVLFTYNKHVESVQINILDKSAESTIISSLEGRLDAWRTTVCPKNSREALTPYTIADAPNLSPSPLYDTRHQLLEDDEAMDTKGVNPDFL